jgi:hypothetical protein
VNRLGSDLRALLSLPWLRDRRAPFECGAAYVRAEGSRRSFERDGRSPMRTFSSACRCFCTNGSIWPCRNLAACHGAPAGTAPECECSYSQLRTQLGRYPPRMRPICTLKAPPHIVGILLLRQRSERLRARVRLLTGGFPELGDGHAARDACVGAHR